MRTLRCGVAGGGRLGVPLALILVALASLVTAGLAAPTGSTALLGSGTPKSVSLDPGLFSDLSSGVVLIRGFSCSGTAKVSGTGFLVGSDVVMTARHVVDPLGEKRALACRVKVKVDGHWVRVTKTAWWYRSADPTGRGTDLATLKLAQPAASYDHLFDFRNSSPRIGTNLAMLGHPLGNDISLTQGKLLSKHHLNRVPLLIIDLLGAEGASGSPIVDNSGHVVGVLQLGLGGKDILGQRTSGVVAGIDLSSWWGSGHKVEQTLCHAYPRGGIPNCGKNPAPSPAPTPPAPPAVPAPASFADSTGEDANAPDITSVNVSAQAGGNITFKINVSNRPTFTSDMAFLLYLNVDKTTATGDPQNQGADYVIVFSPSGADLGSWSGTSYDFTTPQTSLTRGYDATGATLNINSSDLGSPTSLGFFVDALSGITIDGTGQADFSNAHIDVAPDYGKGVYTYMLAG
jgi:V8-like Glu-specific endopeptidase